MSVNLYKRSLWVHTAFINLTIFLLSVFPVSAQSIDKKKLDGLLDSLHHRGLITGSLAISVNGKTVYQRAVGFTTLDSNRKTLPGVHTKYKIGSATKMYTAAMIFQLIEERKLSLKTKLATFFPQLPHASRISIEDMLYHRSGLHDYTHDTNFRHWMDQPKTHEQMLEIIAGKGLDFESGTKALYSNTNYLLLGYIIESITATTYAKALQKRILSKIGLRNTYYGALSATHRYEANSYKYVSGKWMKEKQTHRNIHGGAGSIVSTPGDLNQFMHGLFNGKLISPESLSRMTSLKDDYGMGLFVYPFEEITGYGHNGRIEEFYTATRYFPGKRLAVSYITNGILYPRVDILEGVLKICFNKDYAIPFSGPLVTDFQKYTGTYSSADLPFKVVCKVDSNQLIFEAAGRTMVVQPVSTHYFMDLQSGSFFEFLPGKDALLIKETDNVYYLQKEK